MKQTMVHCCANKKAKTQDENICNILGHPVTASWHVFPLKKSRIQLTTCPDFCSIRVKTTTLWIKKGINKSFGLLLEGRKIQQPFKSCIASLG